MKLNILVPSVLLGSAILMASTPAFAGKDKKDLSDAALYRSKVESLQKEIEQAEQSIRDKQKEKALILGKGAGYDGNCDTACLPSSSSACSDHDLALAKITSATKASGRVCIAIFLAVSDLDQLSSTCNAAVTSCGFVAKKLDIKAIDESIKSIRNQIHDKEKEISELHEKRKNLDGCEACQAKSGGIGSWIKENVFSRLGLDFDSHFGLDSCYMPSSYNYRSPMVMQMSMQQMMMARMYSNPAMFAMMQASSNPYQYQYMMQFQAQAQYQQQAQAMYMLQMQRQQIAMYPYMSQASQVYPYQMQIQMQVQAQQQAQYQYQMQAQYQAQMQAQYQAQVYAAQMNARLQFQGVFPGSTPYALIQPRLNFQTTVTPPGPFVYTGNTPAPGGSVLIH